MLNVCPGSRISESASGARCHAEDLKFLVPERARWCSVVALPTNREQMAMERLGQLSFQQHFILLLG